MFYLRSISRIVATWVAGLIWMCLALAAHGVPDTLEDCRPYDFGELDEPSGSYEQFHGQPIRGITVKRINVFDPNDPRENNALYRFLNKLHINTKEKVVRSQLLFAEGETLDAGAVAESERILRSKPYLSYAAIHVGQVCTEGVVLLVITRDVWTTEPIVNVSREGGDTESGFGFKEGNVLGHGSELSLVFEKNAERSRTQYNYASPHLFNTRLRFQLGYTDTSDGQSSTFALDRPFYSLQSQWAMGLYSIDFTQTEKIRFHDEVVNAYQHKQERYQMYAGIGLGVDPEAAHRFVAGLTQVTDYYDELAATEPPLPVDSEFIYPWLEYQYIQDVFAVYRNLDLIHRVEDVSLGVSARVRVGHGGDSVGNDVEFSYLDAEIADVITVGDNRLLKFNALAQGTWAKDETFSHRVWGGGVRYYYLMGEFHRYFAEVQYHQGHNLLPHDQLTAGGENGLRGYPLDYQRGEKRLLVSFENRYITSWHIFNLFRVGAVGFVDAGRAWGAGYSKSNFLANVGIGLRFSSSKAKLDHIAHLDLATPLVDRDQVDAYQLVMKVEAHF